MVDRLIKLPKKNSFFLFGPRGVGKTTLIEHALKLDASTTLFLNLLDPEVEAELSVAPNRLQEMIHAKRKHLKCVVIDEVQKIPALLDLVHLVGEKNKSLQFVLTGSSARKLKRGAANLLAGRAFALSLHPLCSRELESLQETEPTLDSILSFGTLPRILSYSDDQDKKRFLRAYSQTYLKEEIQAEQIVRQMTSFRQFLDFAAQNNAQMISYSRISKQSGVDEKTVARFYEILVDTLVGRFLEPFDESIRVRQKQKPKFFFFDTGVQRALSQMLEIPLVPRTSEYGLLFEQFIFNECVRLNDYFEKDFQFFYLRTNNDVEVDLIIRKPGRRNILVEIKSSDHVTEDQYRSLMQVGKEIECDSKIVICREKKERLTADGIRIMPWKDALQFIFS